MIRRVLSSLPLALAAFALPLGTGCQDPNTQPPAPVFSDRAPLTATINGFSWDPEAYLVLAPQCPDCQPGMWPGQPPFENTKLKGSQISIFDANAGAPVPGSAVSDDSASWSISGIPAGPNTFYLPMAATSDTFANATPDTDPMYPGPKVSYLPTLTLRPIVANYGSCILVESASISDVGIVQAVANHLGVSVQDVVGGPNSGGLGIFWLNQPGIPLDRLPAFDTAVKVSDPKALTFNINWAPPGSGPPGQSDRGFFVDDSSPTSPLGITAVLVPPELAGTPIEVTGVDPTTDASQGRPWSFGPLDVPLSPGVVTFGGFNVDPDPSTQPPPDPDLPQGNSLGGWFCL